MAYLDPRESSDHLRDQTLEALKTHFPIKGSTHTVELASLSVGEGLDPDDIREQHKMKVEGGNFAVPVHGHLRLIENSTGNVVDEKKLRLVDLPQMTSRYSYIVGGKEYQVANQWQLKPGAYTHRGKDGQLKTQFNVVNKSPLALTLHPESGGVKMEYRSAELPVYPMLRALGVTDTEVEKRLGKDFLAANKGTRGENAAIAQFYKSSTKKDAPDEHTALKHFVDQMADSKLDPTATKHTLGAAVDHVSGDALLRAIERLHKVHNGAPEDDKDSLVFKNLRSTGDYAADKIREHGKAVRSRVGRQINASTKLRQIIPPGLFNAPIRDTFTDNAASELAAQINPVEMLGKNSQTTVLGPGGISSEQQILDSVKLINQSHMAFQDTVVTPESSRTGVNLRLPMGLKKVGVEAKVHLHNVRTGKTELVDAAKFLTSNVVLPDQVEWKNGKPVPLGDSVRVAGDGNHFKDVPFSKADYVLRHSSQLFSSTTNLIPFLGSVSGNRASMATRHIEQAISLVDREPPLVQAATGSDVHGIHTFDEVLGKHAAHVSPVHGTVTSIQPDGIHISTGSGSKEVQLYNNFPLNDAKSVLHSTPIVKVGDKVTKGQVLADTNYSKNGVLALGRNLRTAYLDFKGLNYEDGLVISETAAKKLSSHHMYKDTVQVSSETILDRKKFLEKLPGLYNVKTQVGHLGEDGIALVGSKVKPGDPLILAMKPYDLKSRTNDKAYQKALLGTHTDNSLRWHGEVEGEVVSVHKQDGAVHVHVRTVEPAKVGDKASARSANKGVISAILPDKDMPHSRDGAPLEILMSPLGVPGRMNPSQILETAAGKIAMKTGKPYIVPNFKPGLDAVSHVQAELKKHGLSDTEELVDPVSGHSLGKVMTGYQHVLKLVHQSDKKLSVTSGMGLPGVQGGDTYDNNLQPKSGQRLGSLGTYAMLAHGSVHNLREFQALKGEGADSETDERKRWSSAHLDAWNAIQTGTPLPTPKKSFAFHKFEEMLRGSGINVEKKGHEVFVTPLTDKHVLELAGSRIITKPGEILNARTDKHSGEMVPKVGGLFDPKLTGGHNGKLWSRFPLAEPMPNPIFEGPIKSLTGLSGAQFDGLLGGTHSVTSDGKVVAGIAGPHRGGHAIEHLLKKIDVPKELEAAKAKLSAASPSKVDECLKRVKYLHSLSVTGTSASDAYVMKNIAVIPPALRPASILNDGKNIDYADINERYKHVGIVNTKLNDPMLRHAPEEQSKLRVDLYKRIAGISGYGIPFADAKHKGLLHTIAGAQPKCFDGVTEVLTPAGWVPLAKYDGTSTLATVNLAADEFEWQSPSDFHISRYVGSMHYLAGAAIDLLVTPNHNHVMSRVGYKKNKRTYGEWKLTPSTALLGPMNRSRIMTAPARWSGVRPSYSFCGVVPDPEVFAHFVGWWLAEGWLAHTSHVYLPQSTLRGVQEIDGWIDRLGIPFKRAEYVKKAATTGKVVYWWMQNPELQEWLRTNVGSGAESKFLSSEILSWDSTLLLALLKGYLAGDGDTPSPAKLEKRHRRTYNRSSRDGGRFATSSLQLMDDLQHLALKVGLRVSAPKPVKKQKEHHHQLYRASVLGFRDTSFGEHLRVQVVHFDGHVYGPTVPNGTVVVRRNGVVSVSGNSGMFQKRITQKRQDLSMAAVVIPEPSLGLNEVGFPREAALDLFRPFVVRKLQEMGHASNPLEAQKVLALRGPASFAALQKVVEERPTLLKRDPSLHKYSIQGFDVKLTTGNAIKLHPLVCGGFTADFDGDVMRAYVPISKDAISEVHRMKPTNNLFSEASNRLMYVPTLGSALGIYKTSLPGKDTGKEFSSHGHVVAAARDKSITVNDIVTVDGKKTTAGRVLLSMTLPQALQGDVLHDIHKPLDAKALDSLLTRLGKDHHADFDKSVNMIKDVGYHASFGVIPVPGMPQGKEVYIPVGAHSLSLKDLQTHSSVRDGLLATAHSDVAKIRKTDGHTAAADARVVDRYQTAETAMKASVTNVDPLHGSNLHTMFKAGVKPGWDQYKQLVFAPMLLKDSTGRTIPTPVTRSYSEGLDVSGYWTQMHGARSGSVQKVQAVQDPGYLSKLLMQSSVDTLVSSHDCGTKRGVLLPVADDDVHDRVLAADYHTDKLHLPAGTMLNPRTVGQIRAADHTAKLLVRSPMRCEHGEGICQKCAGLSSSGQLHQVGANIGVHAAQAVGERAVQLMLKAFHTGGVAVVGGGSKTLGAFDRLNQLTGLPENIPYSATLSMRAGKVEEIKHTPTGVHVVVAGKSHFVGKDPAGHPLHEPHGPSDWSGLKVGQHVAAGDHLSDPHRTVVNPHHLYEATGSMERVQNHLADEVFKLYKGEGILRKHVEVVVRNMSNLTKVVEPGDASGILRGEFKPASSVHALNKQLLAAGRQPVEHTPVLRGVSTMPQAIQEDWMAKLQHMGIRNTLVNAAAEGAVSHLHGAHPIPGLAYGAEFGLNKAHSNLPGRRHLADVKEYHY